MPTLVLLFLAAVVVIVGAVWVWLGRFNRRCRLDAEFKEAFGFGSPERDTFCLRQGQSQVFRAVYKASMELAEARANVEHHKKVPNKDRAEGPSAILILVAAAQVVKEKEVQYKRIRKLARNAGYTRAFLADIDLEVRRGLRSKKEASPPRLVGAAS